MKPVEEIAREIVRGHRREHGYGPQPDAMVDALAAALRAERERAERAEAYVTKLQERLEMTHAWVRADDGTMTMISVEPGRFPDGIECRDDTIKTLTANNDALLARAEKAEAERDETIDKFRQTVAEMPSAFIAARNRALEEAAECVKDCRQWEPECPHAARILSLRIPEAST